MQNETLAPPWLHLLSLLEQGWREKELGRGRDPDPYIEKGLREKGVWPPISPPSSTHH